MSGQTLRRRARAVVAIDGQLVPSEAAVVPVHDRGFLYGDGVFETLRAEGGRPTFLREHVARLDAALATVRIEGLELARVEDTVLRACAFVGAPFAHVRIVVSRGENQSLVVSRAAGVAAVTKVGPSPSLASSPRLVVVVTECAPPLELEARPAAAVTRLGAVTPVAGVKSTSYAPSLLAQAEAEARGAAHALALDASGSLLEGATSNVFVEVDGALLTPPASLGILPGVARGVLLASGVASEGTVSREQLARAGEVFVTSSYRGVVPLSALDGRALEAPGAFARVAHRALEAARAR
jgi:branched-chain amino acid aminotransferase